MKEPEAICTGVREQFALLLYGELNFDEEERVETHLDSCADCRTALERQRSLHAVADAAAVTPSPALLASCRENLAAALRPAESRPVTGWWRQFIESFRQSRWRPVLRPAGAFAMLAVGFLGAQFVPAPRLGGSYESMNLADFSGSRVRNVSAQQDGRVQIVLDETRQRTIQGSVNDEAIRTLLMAASKEAADPELRAGTVAILVSGARSAEVRNALMFALKNDRSGDVRAKAMDGLQPYSGDHAVQGALAQVLLRDTDRGMRSRAIDLLAGREQRELDPETVGALQELMEREQDAYVRNRGLRVLQAVNASGGIY